MASEAPTAGIPSESEEAGAKKKVTCEFCESTIAPTTGDVLKLSDKAKGFRDLEAENKRLKSELSAEKQAHDLLKARLEHDPPSPPAPRYSGDERRRSQRVFFKERRKGG
jgi:hypothetical protein